MEGQSERWNRIFRRLDGGEAGHDAWLERWAEVLGDGEGSVLDLGCGAGHDTRFLVEHGFPVVAADFSGEGWGIAAAEERTSGRFEDDVGGRRRKS